MSASPAMLHWLARAGYASRGIVYVLIGYLAAVAAWSGTQPKGAKGALQELWGGWAGQAILIAIGVGLFLFALWRLVQSLLDQDDHGRDAKGLVIRAGLLMSAVTYTLLGLFAIGFLIGGGGDDGGGGSRKVAAYLLNQPFGRVLLCGVALVILGVGFAHLWKAFKKKYLDHFEMSKRVERWASPVARFGLAMRGITFFIIGGFFVAAALRGQSDKAVGLAEAMGEVQDLAYGWILLGLIALGLAAFGLYSLIEAVWRRVDVPGDGVEGIAVFQTETR